MVFRDELIVWGSFIYTGRLFDEANGEQYTAWIISKTSL